MTKHEINFRHGLVKHPKLYNPIEKHFSVATKYHYYIWIILFLSEWPTSLHLLSLIFISPPMEYTCDISGKNGCPCEAPVWNLSVFTETIQTKYSLHCNRTWLNSFSESIYYAGFLIGALLFGFLSDR